MSKGQCPYTLLPVCVDDHDIMTAMTIRTAFMKKILMMMFYIDTSDDDIQDCTRRCPATFLPVCGSNGQTYSNECNLRYNNDNDDDNDDDGNDNDDDETKRQHHRPLSTATPLAFHPAFI